MKKEEHLGKRIYNILINHGEKMSLSEIYESIPDKPSTTIRGRIYRYIDKLFKKVDKGVYWVADVLVIEGDGRKLPELKDNSIDAIVTDHPWSCKSNVGTNRNFTNGYENETFKYILEDFVEKYRVLKPGAFLVEILPAENAENYEYLYQIKQMAKEAGFEYYSKVAWKKGNFKACTGRKIKTTEDVLFLTKGRPRKLRFDKQRTIKTGKESYMIGAREMLPDMFDFQPPSRKEKIHQSEKPASLLEAIIKLITLPGEIVLDQFAGSGSLGRAVLNVGDRIGILYEKLRSNINAIIKNLGGIEILPEIKEKEEVDSVLPSNNKVEEAMQLSLF